MVKYLGAIILLIGAILLIVEGFQQAASNTLLWLGLSLVIVGYLVHIFLGRKLTV